MASVVNGSQFGGATVTSIVRRVNLDGSIETVAGSANALPYREGLPATRSPLDYYFFFSLSPDGTLVLSGNADPARVTAPLPGPGGTFAIPSREGDQIYVFSVDGVHQQTLDSRTGVALLTFAHDGEGRLSSITDESGNVTQLVRAPGGDPTRLDVVGPYGQTSHLVFDATTGDLRQLVNPANESVSLEYHGDSGLLAALTDARGGRHEFSFDADGLLIADEDPVTLQSSSAAFWSLSRSSQGPNWTVSKLSGEGRSTSFSVERQPDGSRRRTVTDAAGLSRAEVRTQAGVTTTLLPDGTTETVELGPDPRFGMMSPLEMKRTTRLPSGLTRVVERERSATLTDPSNVLSFDSWVESYKLNGKTFTTTFDPAQRTFTTTTPLGRQTVTHVDALGHADLLQIAGVEPMATSYDSRGRPTLFTQASRQSQLGYDGARAEPLTRTNALEQTSSFSYDAVGRVLSQTAPDSTVTQFGYDAAGNLTSLTPPGKPAHGMSYTPVDQLASYDPPAVSGSGTASTTYQQNLDRQPTTETRPDGVVISRTYDAAGRLSTVSYGNDLVTYGYDAQTGQLTSITGPGPQSLSFGYDGLLQTSTTWSGPVSGTVSREYDADFRVSAEKVNGASTVSYGYDDDGLVTSAGPMQLVRDAQNGRVVSATVGGISETWGYNAFGEETSHEVKFGQTVLYAVTYGRDELGRIHTKDEQVEGQSRSWEYGYDLQGRLVDATRTVGSLVQHAHYDYDANGNRIAADVPWSAESTVALGQAVYDGQDRLLQYGATTFTYGANGELATRTDAAGTTTYVYDAMGNLTSVTLPNGDVASYSVDGQNRRIARKVNGAVTQQWLYGDQLRIVAELDANGAEVSRFVYETGSHSPDLMVRGGVTYRLVKDQVGTPVRVVDATTGAVVQEMRHDPWGIQLFDTSTGFQPFGFGGGVIDGMTPMVRLGARDYDPIVARWTDKDPIRFDARSSNLYGFVLNDPINHRDSSGLSAEGCGSDGWPVRSPGEQKCLIKCFNEKCDKPWNDCVSKAKDEKDKEKCYQENKDCERGCFLECVRVTKP